MTSDDFVRGYLGLFPDTAYNKVNKSHWKLHPKLINMLTFTSKVDKHVDICLVYTSLENDPSDDLPLENIFHIFG